MEKQAHWLVSCDKEDCEAFLVTRELLRLPPSHVFMETGALLGFLPAEVSNNKWSIDSKSIFKNLIAKFYLILDMAETQPN